MIKIEKVEKPSYLVSDEVEIALEKLDEFYLSKNRSQKRYSFPFVKRIDVSLKPILFDSFHGKCGYCETKIESQKFGVIDRFRPYSGVRDKNEYFEDLYWWLAYDWENLIYSCKECSQYKANYFPVESNRVTSKKLPVLNEEQLLLNPYQDFTEEHLDYNFEGELISNTKKGLQTIELLHLNRTSLTENRRKAISEIDRIIDLYLDGKPVMLSKTRYLNRIYNKDPQVEFLLLKYKHLLAELESNPFMRKHIIGYDHEKLQQIIKDDRRVNTQELIHSDFFPIEYVEIKNFKCIDIIKIEFPPNEVESQSWVVFLGENGLGKSSILQAICLGLAPIIKNKKDIVKFIQKDKTEATIIIKEKNSTNILKTVLNRQSCSIDHTGEFSTPLIGYGSVRLLAKKRTNSERGRNVVKYQNLFDPYTPLDDILSWLLFINQKDKKRFNSIAYSLKQLLPNGVDEDLIFENGELIFSKSKASFSNLSDGYKNTISLALDIMKTLSGEKADMDKLSGIVLIDELGNQLHPRWQMQVVSQFRRVFPRINFIISTHHPLCLRGLRKDEVMILNKNMDQQIFIIKDLPDPSLLRVDQILTSPYFGLHSAVDPAIEELFNEYYALLAKDKLTDEEENRKMELSDKVPKMKFLGDSLREELAIYVIDELLAKKVREQSESLNLDDLKEEAKKRVKTIWDNLNDDEELI